MSCFVHNPVKKKDTFPSLTIEILLQNFVLVQQYGAPVLLVEKWVYSPVPGE